MSFHDAFDAIGWLHEIDQFVIALEARTAWVEWRCPHRETPQEARN